MSSEDLFHPEPDEGLEALLAEVGSDDRPPADWQARVWRRIGERQAPRTTTRSVRSSWWRSGWLMAPAGALAAAAVAFILLRPAPPAEPGLEVAIVRGEGPLRRGTEARSGDRLQLTAQVGTATHAELRVYRQDVELVLRCSEEPPCRRRGELLEAVLVLEKVGAYQPLLLTSDRPLPASVADLDTDAGAALAAGAEAWLGEPVEVR